jgi:hypothetical protein
LSKLVSEFRNDKHSREYLNTRYEVLELDPHATHLIVIAELVDASLPQKLIGWLLFLNKSGKILMKLSSLMVVYKGLDSLTDSLLECGMLEKDKLLRQLGLAG